MNKTTMFVLGGIAGAAAALMVAPRPGDETRAIVTDWANGAIGGKGSDLGERLEVRKLQLSHDAGVIVNQAGELASAGVEKAKSALSSAPVPPAFNKQEAESDAELRARIEQARARIANQVAANAAKATEAVGETVVPTVTEAAKDVANRVQEAAKDVKAVAAKDEPAEAEKAE